MQKSKKKIYLSISMYSLHLNYYLLTISVTNTSKYIEVRQTVTHSHGKLKGKKHNTKQNTTKKSVCLLPFYNNDQKPRLRSLQARVCTENANVFFFFFCITGDYGNEGWQIACQTLLTGLLGSCIWPAVILSMIIASLSQSSKNWHFWW